MKLNPFSIVLTGVILYLSYHAVAGQQGLSKWAEMQDRVVALEKQNANLLTRRAVLEDSTHRLYPETLDKDFLEELARTKFHFVHPDEFVMEPPSLSAQLPENEELFALSNP